MSSSEGFVDDNENLMRTDAPERTILATVSGATRATIRETKRNETYRRRPSLGSPIVGEVRDEQSYQPKNFPEHQC